ncbi:MAG: acylneuraminate cytidylyltransferase family protein [Clostridiales bacterium]|jgi:N-acylneuraminate cytidylyltransferase|nr:acylneuraminate cytidylyltransferase family protein [Clostridiales bacterium]
MKNMVAFIPIRGGSKSIPLKNIRIINGKPLVYWTVLAAHNCSGIDKVYVATDSQKISDTVNSFGFENVRVIGRDPENATDTASTESVMLEFAEQYDFDDIILIQATSPLLSAEDLCKGIEEYYKDDVDSVLSVVRQKRFIWNNQGGYVKPQNYDIFSRPRRQEFDGYLVENGAFYITSKKLLLENRCRISGRIVAVEMNEETYFEIDEISDWLIVEELMKQRELNK